MFTKSSFFLLLFSLFIVINWAFLNRLYQIKAALGQSGNFWRLKKAASR